MFLDRPSSRLLESSLENSKLSPKSPSRASQANPFDTPDASAALRFSASLIALSFALGDCPFYPLFRTFLDPLQDPFVHSFSLTPLLSHKVGKY